MIKNVMFRMDPSDKVKEKTYKQSEIWQSDPYSFRLHSSVLNHEQES